MSGEKPTAQRELWALESDEVGIVASGTLRDFGAVAIDERVVRYVPESEVKAAELRGERRGLERAAKLVRECKPPLVDGTTHLVRQQLDAIAECVEALTAGDE